MKKFICFLLICLGFLLSTPVSLTSRAADYTLRVYNWQDYIDDGKDENGNQRYENGVAVSSVISDFEAAYFNETGKTVNVIYTTFETNEVMLNSIKTTNTQYDLVCPSDYVIQRMIREELVESFALDEDGKYTKVPNYQQYGSPYHMGLFESKGWNEYAVNYMWGTLGILYNVEKLNEKEGAPADRGLLSWNILWDSKYKNRVTIKDSVRDTYAIGVIYVYQDELMELEVKYYTNDITATEYSAKVSEIINRRDPDTLAKVEAALKELKKNIAGFEVDSGKNDIKKGTIDINFAWSGDAIYSILTAAEDYDLELAYEIPIEGSNIWFDAWVMPKGAQKDLAQAFVDFLSRPDIARRNMEYIGYTSAIAGDDILDYVNEEFGDDDGLITLDLSYFFDGTLSEGKSAIITTNSQHYGTLLAQYPSVDIIARCGIMEDFAAQNDEVLAMWQRIKANVVPIWIYFIAGGVVVGIGALIIVKKQSKQMRVDRQKRR